MVRQLAITVEDSIYRFDDSCQTASLYDRFAVRPLR